LGARKQKAFIYMTSCWHKQIHQKEMHVNIPLRQKEQAQDFVATISSEPPVLAEACETLELGMSPPVIRSNEDIGF
jgi:hypothetical protein